MELVSYYMFKHNYGKYAHGNKDIPLSKERKRANAVKDFKSFAASHKSNKIK